MKYGCCTTPEYYEHLERLGFDFIELAGKSVATMDAVSFAEIARKIELGKVKCCGFNAYCPPEIVIAGEGYDLPAAVAYAKVVMRRAKEIGARSVGIGAPASRTLPEGFDRRKARRQIIDFLKATAEIADAQGVQLLLEAVCTRECNFLNYTEEALALIRTLALPNLYLVYDLYHSMVMKEDVAIVKEAFPYIRHVHICQDDHGARVYLRPELTGQYQAYFDVLLACGYSGTISLEAFSGDVAEGAARSLPILQSFSGRFT